jgi:hypothetical protein
MYIGLACRRAARGRTGSCVELTGTGGGGEAGSDRLRKSPTGLQKQPSAGLAPRRAARSALPWMIYGNERSPRNDLEQFRYVRMQRHSYDAYMSFSFLSLEFGTCHAKLWATGRHGFTLPKKVEITVPGGATYTYHYHNRKAGLKSELTNNAIVRIAIARFLAGAGARSDVPVEIDEATPPFAGALAQVRASKRPVSLRVRPGALYARGGASKSAAGAGQPAATLAEQPTG